MTTFQVTKICWEYADAILTNEFPAFLLLNKLQKTSKNFIHLHLSGFAVDIMRQPILMSNDTYCLATIM